MHYAVLCNYFWLLIEGIYLQSILSFAMNEKTHFPIYMAFGWGVPWIPVSLWIVSRFFFSNIGCWEMMDNLAVWLTIQIPLIIAIVINFGIFINILRIIINKLRANHMARSDYKYRLARSTLALIPLLGIHYFMFLFVEPEPGGSENAGIYIKLAFEMVFTSFQGAMVAVLYCFMTSEVQTELKKLLRNWKWRRELPTSSTVLIGRKMSTFQSQGGQTQLTRCTARVSDVSKLNGRRTSVSSGGAASSGDSALDSTPRRPLVVRVTLPVSENLSNHPDEILEEQDEESDLF